jgi:hypothetical protein
MPPIVGDAVPPIVGDAMPPIEGDAVPPIGGEAAPPIEGDAMPPIEGDAVPPIGGEAAPLVEKEAVPQIEMLPKRKVPLGNRILRAVTNVLRQHKRVITCVVIGIAGLFLYKKNGRILNLIASVQQRIQHGKLKKLGHIKYPTQEVIDNIH